MTRDELLSQMQGMLRGLYEIVGDDVDSFEWRMHPDTAWLLGPGNTLMGLFCRVDIACDPEKVFIVRPYPVTKPPTLFVSSGETKGFSMKIPRPVT